MQVHTGQKGCLCGMGLQNKQQTFVSIIAIMSIFYFYSMTPTLLLSGSRLQSMLAKSLVVLHSVNAQSGLLYLDRGCQL